MKILINILWVWLVIGVLIAFGTTGTMEWGQFSFFLGIPIGGLICIHKFTDYNAINDSVIGRWLKNN